MTHAPKLTPAQAATAFLTPRRPEPGVPLDLPGASRMRVATPEVELAAVVAGDGPGVLMLHGWEGQASDLAPMARALVAAGRRVVALDLPAHGDSGGRQASIPHAARALLHAAPALGPLDAVVAHSVGTAVAITALSRGLVLRRAALLAAPARYADFVHRFADQVGLDAEGAAGMIAHLLDQGVDVAGIDATRLVRRLTASALYVHSADDRVVPIADARAACAAWPDARLLQVERLGHRRLLDDPPVIDSVVRFVTGHADADAAQLTRRAEAL